MKDLTRYRYDDGGNDSDSWGESPTAYMHRKWLESHRYLVLDSTLQDIADAWQDDTALEQGDLRITWPELAVLLDALVERNNE